MVQAVKNPLAVQETQVSSLGQEDLLEEEMAIHSSILAWSKRKQSGLKNIITEMKNIVKGINNRLERTEEQIRDLEDKIMEIKQ